MGVWGGFKESICISSYGCMPHRINISFRNTIKIKKNITIFPFEYISLKVVAYCKVVCSLKVVG